MRVRRRPIILDAVEWLGQELDGVERDSCGCDQHCTVMTLEGRVNVTVGDFVVTGVAGEKWPVRPDIFWKTYEKVEDEGC